MLSIQNCKPSRFYVREQQNQMPPIKQHYLSCHEHPECREDYGRAAKGDERRSEIPKSSMTTVSGAAAAGKSCRDSSGI
ncbi:hypothetical protein L596_020988 [Steinernema carpocapsae]|uniref:Uncharacterized protein n=1 Tax=Steinernema carpocapsae TaxID=34508 RepID=A0A4U5MVC6_STECR|nr:hypothetical protein L596_020988 [Steinernema carpocapsae]